MTKGKKSKDVVGGSKGRRQKTFPSGGSKSNAHKKGGKKKGSKKKKK